MKHKTFFYIEEIGIKEVESTNVDVNDIINALKLKKEKHDNRTLQRLKREFKGKTIRKLGDNWLIN